MTKIVSLIIFLIGYIAISQEHILKISKTAISLLLGVSLWILVIVGGQNGVDHALVESGAEIFGLVIFLLSAMTLVEILTHYGFFFFFFINLFSPRVQNKKHI